MMMMVMMSLPLLSLSVDPAPRRLLTNQTCGSPGRRNLTAWTCEPPTSPCDITAVGWHHFMAQPITIRSRWAMMSLLRLLFIFILSLFEAVTSSLCIYTAPILTLLHKYFFPCSLFLFILPSLLLYSLTSFCCSFPLLSFIYYLTSFSPSLLTTFCPSFFLTLFPSLFFSCLRFLLYFPFFLASISSFPSLRTVLQYCTTFFPFTIFLFPLFQPVHSSFFPFITLSFPALLLPFSSLISLLLSFTCHSDLIGLCSPGDSPVSCKRHVPACQIHPPTPPPHPHSLLFN